MGNDRDGRRDSDAVDPCPTAAVASYSIPEVVVRSWWRLLLTVSRVSRLNSISDPGKAGAIGGGGSDDSAKQPPPGIEAVGSRLCSDNVNGDVRCCRCEEDAADKDDKDAALLDRALGCTFVHAKIGSVELSWCCGGGLLREGDDDDRKVAPPGGGEGDRVAKLEDADTAKNEGGCDCNCG